MLLVTFHGGGDASSVNNVVAYSTSDGQQLTATLLSQPADIGLNELRAVVLANGYLYVACGGTESSAVLCYQLANSGASATFVSTLLACTLNGSEFETAIAHPFGLAFAGADGVYVSNQDTNAVARAALTNCATAATLGNGIQSAYLRSLYPSPAVFLDGTYVASQTGALPNVGVTAPDVKASQGGLAVNEPGGKVQNSVRDVALTNNLLLVCDEPGVTVKTYATADGSYLASSNTLAHGPTHLTIANGDLFVSAKDHLYWSKLPTRPGGAALNLQEVDLTIPKGWTIGGLALTAADPAMAYVVLQAGTAGADGGSIYSFTVTASGGSSPPTFSNGQAFVDFDPQSTDPNAIKDTPEFVLLA